MGIITSNFFSCSLGGFKKGALEVLPDSSKRLATEWYIVDDEPSHGILNPLWSFQVSAEMVNRFKFRVKTVTVPDQSLNRTEP